LIAKTEDLTVFATAHSAFFHPLVAAKQFATIGEISPGRFGLNIVCGWNQPEYAMFGLELSESHDLRYELGQSWWDVIRRAWTSSKPFDWDDNFFKIQNGRCTPQPFLDKLPPVMNAGSSSQGQEFAAKNCDFLFTVMIDIESGRETVRKVKDLAAKKYKRDIDIFTTTYVVCRPTIEEAVDYHNYYAKDMADNGAVDRLMSLMGMHAHSFPRDQIESLRTNFAAGHGVYPLIGDPDSVADEIEKIARAGFGGISMSFVNYNAELPFFIQEVIPRLERKGLRAPIGAR
jgi:alkanesulfonate monooxygenase SsuD/methylene tetrahydromethanopterin reductase-like flavin-dependent oxidoreductase (luciferase family)